MLSRGASRSVIRHVAGGETLRNPRSLCRLGSHPSLAFLAPVCHDDIRECRHPVTFSPRKFSLTKKMKSNARFTLFNDPGRPGHVISSGHFCLKHALSIQPNRRFAAMQK